MEKFAKQLLIVFTVLFCLTTIGYNQTIFTEFAIAETFADNEKIADLKETNEIVSKNNQSMSSLYFTKGVYVTYNAEDKNPSKDYFYIFYDEKSGHTEDGIYGIGLPFVCKQMDGVIKFYFGGPDPESEDFLTIESFNNGIVMGYFKDGKKLVFEPLSDANPDKFDAQKYFKKSHKKHFRFFKKDLFKK